jgi:NAD(P)H-hydrate epimerase
VPFCLNLSLVVDYVEALMKVVTVDQMQHIESGADAAGHSYAEMMEQAGRSVADVIEAKVGALDKRVLVLVGPGSNGGDGLVAARYLSEDGADVTCYLYRERDPTVDENFRLVLEAGVRAALAEEDDGWERLFRLVSQADILVDALLGTGTHLPLRDGLAEMLEVINRAVVERRKRPQEAAASLLPGWNVTAQEAPLTVAIDGPTGLEFGTGALDEAALSADLTVTLAYPKIGHFAFPGAAAVGELVVADIGIEPALAEDIQLEVATPAMVREWLPPRPLDAHKGTFGKIMIVAGSINYTGAAYLAGAAATRAGAGLVTLALAGSIHSTVGSRLAEATYILLPEALGVVSRDAAEVLRESLDGYSALLVGPGLGREDETVGFLERLLGGLEERRSVGFLHPGASAAVRSDLPPLVIDADGLGILAGLEDWPSRLPPETILTPHPGEMARLIVESVDDVQADRVATAQARAAEWRQVVVLKGAYTVVAAPDGRVVIEPFSNPGLATAGTGDVLAGTIAALRGQGLGAFEAAVTGAYLHGFAGELARQTIGAAGMVASDMLAHLPTAWRWVTDL